MKTFRLIVVSAVFTTIFALSVFAQTAGKAGVIYSGAFEDEKVGITKLVAALNSLETEFAPRAKSLQALADRITTVGKEAQKLQEAYQANPNGPIGPAQIQPKADEYEKLQTQLKREQEDGKNAYGRRLQQVTEPIYKEIGAALEEFTKQKGYSMLFDGSKDEKGVLLFVDEKSDATKEFIAFCNVKMSGPATPKPVTPK